MTSDLGPEAGGGAMPDQAAATPERVQGLERENADLKDRLLRSLAEMENLRRRSEREMQDARAYAITKFAADIIGTADNLRRALDSLPQVEAGEESPERLALKPLIDGVELTERELLKALERHGVKKRAPTGERFDPHKDQAVFEIPDESVASGTVMQVMQAGYTIGERILRPAMVGVSKGGPAWPTAEAEAPAEKSNPAPANKPESRGQSEAPPRPKFDKRA